MSGSSYLGRIAARSASDGTFAQRAPLEPVRTPLAEPEATQEPFAHSDAPVEQEGPTMPGPQRERARPSREPLVAPLQPKRIVSEPRPSAPPPRRAALSLSPAPNSATPPSGPVPPPPSAPFEPLTRPLPEPPSTRSEDALAAAPHEGPLMPERETAQAPQAAAPSTDETPLSPEPTLSGPFEAEKGATELEAQRVRTPDPGANDAEVAARVAAALARMDQLLRPERAARSTEPQPPPSSDAARVTIGKVRVEVVSSSPPAPAPARAAAAARGVSQGATLGGLPSPLRFGLGQV